MPSPSENETDAADWVVALEHVSKDYPPPAPLRLRRAFARLGGLHVEEGVGADALSGMAEDDDDELADAAPDEDVAAQPRAVGRVVDGVTLRAQGGSVVGLVGPPGAGKTVLLKLIAGLVPPSEGRVIVRGSLAPALSLMAVIIPARGHRVETALPQLGGMVGVSPRSVRSRLDEIAELLDVPSLLKSSTSLMEGSRKRELILAMALSLDPDILLLDMPIRPGATGDRFLERVDALRARGALVVTEMRDLRKTRLVPDRIVALERGRLADPSAVGVPDGTVR